MGHDDEFKLRHVRSRRYNNGGTPALSQAHNRKRQRMWLLVHITRADLDDMPTVAIM